MEKNLERTIEEIKRNPEKEYSFPEIIRENSDSNHGMMVEKIFNVEENNLKTADLGTHELKTKRANSTSRTTLFCMEPTWVENYSMRKFIDAVKISETNQRANTTVSLKENNKGLKLDSDSENIYLYFSNQRIAHWPITEIKERASKKLDKLILSKVEMEEKTLKIKNIETYECFSEEKFIEQIKQQKIVVEFRGKITNDNKIRNRGTCFRIHSKDIKLLYGEKK